MPRPFADLSTDELLHAIRETLIKHQTGAAESTGDDFDHLVTLANATDELDQRMTAGEDLPGQWRDNR